MSLVAVLGFSTLPVAAHLFAGDADPFMYAAALMLAYTAAVGLHLVASGQPVRALTGRVLSAAAAVSREGIRGRVTVVVLFAGPANQGLFVAASHHAGIVAATVLNQLWPLTVAVLLAERNGPLRRRLTAKTAALMAAAFVATAAAVASQSTGDAGRGIWWLGVAFGVAAGVLGGAMVSETVVIGYHAGRVAGPGEKYDAADAAAVMTAALMVSTAAGVIVNTAVAAVSGGFAHGLRPSTALGVTAAAAVVAAGAISSRQALARCSGLGIVAVQGLDIVLALVWLALAGAGFRNGWMFAGCVAVLAAVNTLIQTSDAGR